MFIFALLHVGKLARPNGTVSFFICTKGELKNEQLPDGPSKANESVKIAAQTWQTDLLQTVIKITVHDGQTKTNQTKQLPGAELNWMHYWLLTE